MASQLKLKYTKTFIDVERPTDEGIARARSLSPTPATQSGGPETGYNEQQDRQYVRDLSLKLQTLTMENLKAAVPAPSQRETIATAAVTDLSGDELSIGSVGHPELCCRPCILFVKGFCSDGANCNFCHEAHSTKEAKLDKMQREIMQSLTIQQSAALILGFVRSRLLQMDVPGKQALLDCLEHEASTQQVLPRSISSWELRRLKKTLSRMNVYSLLAVFTNPASQYSDVDRMRAEVVFSLVQSIRKQLLGFQNETDEESTIPCP